MKFKGVILLLFLGLVGGCSSGDSWTVESLPPRVQLDSGILTVTVEETEGSRATLVVRIEGPVKLEGAYRVGLWYNKKGDNDPVGLTFGQTESSIFQEGIAEYRFHIYGLSKDETYGAWPYLQYADRSQVTGDVVYFNLAEFPRPVPDTPSCTIGEDGVRVTLSSSLPEGMTGVTGRGFCVMPSAAKPDGRTPRIAAPGEAAVFSIEVDTLRRGILYYVWPYVKDVYGLRFGSWATVRIPVPELIPSVRTIPGATIYYRQVTAAGQLVDDCGGSVELAGIQWAKSMADFENGSGRSYASDVGGDGAFSAFKNLSTAGTWYYRAFVTTIYGTGYGDILSVDVPDFLQYLPVVSTDARPVKNTAVTVTVSGMVEQGAGPKITERGFCHSSSFDPQDYSSLVKVSGSTGQMTAVIEGVPMNKTYYYRAYAENAAGTAYGEVRSIYIRSSDFEVDFHDLKAVVNSAGSVTFSVRIWNDRGQKFKERGFCWRDASYSDPTISDDAEKTRSSYGSDYEVKVSSYKIRKGTRYRVRAYVIAEDGAVWYSDRSEKVLFTVPDK